MGVPKEIIQFVFQLLPGFFTAWVFYGITAYRKPNTFERVIEALVFTVIVQSLVWVVRFTLLICGEIVSFGPWIKNFELPLSVALALLLGLGIAWLVNQNWIHQKLWNLGFTSGDSYPSEWFKTLLIEKRWIVLNLSDGRRLFGWPMDWPDHSDAGHFVLTQAEWLLDNGERLPLTEVHKIMIAATDIEFVELLENAELSDGIIDEKG